MGVGVGQWKLLYKEQNMIIFSCRNVTRQSKGSSEEEGAVNRKVS